MFDEEFNLVLTLTSCIAVKVLSLGLVLPFDRQRHVVVVFNKVAVKRITFQFHLIELIVGVFSHLFYYRKIYLATLKILDALGAKHGKLGFAPVIIECK